MAQALDIQLALHKAALSLSGDVEACTDREERARVSSAIASVAKGWQSIQDQIRILKGKPLPGSLRPVQSKSKRTKVEPADPSPIVREAKESLNPLDRPHTPNP